MIGVVTRTGPDGVWVKIASLLPGVELGPLPAIVHRAVWSPETFTTYKAGDRVHVIEDSPNDFLVTGIVSTLVEPPS